MNKRIKLAELDYNVKEPKSKMVKKGEIVTKVPRRATLSRSLLKAPEINVKVATPAPKVTSIMPKSRKPKKQSLNESTFPLLDQKQIVLVDNRKNKWSISDYIGKGGFAVVHNAIPIGHKPVTLFGEKEFAVKIEPKSSGPLFVECSFYRKVVQSELVFEWLKKHKKKFIGLCYSLGFGVFEHVSKEYRFIVIPKLREVLTDVWLRCKKRFHITTVLQIGLHMVDVLHYIHDQGFVHADLKESNMMTEVEDRSAASLSSKLYLIDFGLASQYMIAQQHRPFKMDPKARHDGTIEYCSMDSHHGVPSSRRSDMQVLLFFLLRLYAGFLPWEKFVYNKDLVSDEKRRYWRDIHILVRDCLLLNPDNLAIEGYANAQLETEIAQCDPLVKFAEHIQELPYTTEPNYSYLSEIMQDALQSSEKSPSLMKTVKKLVRGCKKPDSDSFDGFTITFKCHFGSNLMTNSETKTTMKNSRKRSHRRSSILNNSNISMDGSMIPDPLAPATKRRRVKIS